MRHRLQTLAIEVQQAVHQPVVDFFAEQEHLDAFFPENLEMRAAGGELRCRRQQVVDLVLAVLHPAHIVRQRDVLLGTRRRG